jgi:hypothetical protein
MRRGPFQIQRKKLVENSRHCPFTGKVPDIPVQDPPVEAAVHADPGSDLDENLLHAPPVDLLRGLGDPKRQLRQRLQSKC